MKKLTISIVRAWLCPIFSRFEYKSLILLLCLACLIPIGIRAQVKPKSMALGMGQPLPEELWDARFPLVNDPAGKTYFSLSEYRGKLIIIDFWATTCAPCIARFPDLKALEDRFSGQVKTLAVSTEKREVILSFLKAKAGNWAHVNQMKTVTGDTLLGRYFPHIFLPHYVWIDPQGKVAAFTSANELKASYAEEILKSGRAEHVKLKIDQNPDVPLFSAADLPVKQLSQYSILLKGSLEGTGSTSIINDFTTPNVSLRFTNKNLFYLYNMAIKKTHPELLGIRTAIESKDSLILQRKSNEAGKLEEYQNSLYSYQLVLPATEKKHMFAYMFSDLNRYTPYLGEVVKRKSTCIILKADPEIRLSNTFVQQNKLIQLQTLVIRSNRDKELPYPIIDESGLGLNQNADPGPLRIQDLKEKFKAFGVKPTLEVREIDWLIIKDKNN